MSNSPGSTAGVRALLAVIAFVVAVAGMKAAQSILNPMLLSGFFAAIGVPPLFWLRRRGVPNALAILIVLLGMIVLLGLLATLVGTSLTQFTEQVPVYRERLSEGLSTLTASLPGRGIGDRSLEDLIHEINPGQVMNLTATMLNGLRGVLTNIFLIVLIVLFLLAEASGLPEKLRAAFGDSSLERFDVFAATLRRYLALKTAVSLSTGLIVALWVAILGIDFPLLWGLLAFLLNYIPNIGSILAAVPPVVLGFVQFGLARAMLVAAGFVVVNVVIGSVIEPRLMGRGLGLSTLVVFLSLIFWGWVLGPVGMILSVPLTMTIKIALESRDATRWLAILLGPANVTSA